MSMYRVTTICDIVLNDEILESDFDDYELFDSEKQAKAYASKFTVGEAIAYHGEAQDILKEIYIDEIEDI